MKKIIIFILLNFVVNSLYSQRVVTCNDSIRESLVYSYYENSNFLTHNFDYELMLKKSKLMKRSSDVSSLGYLTFCGAIVLNSIIAVNNNWSLWIDIPLATALSIACAYPFWKYKEKLKKRADAIPDYTSAIKQNGDSLYALMVKTSSILKKRYGTGSWQYADFQLWCAMQCANFGDNKQAYMLKDQALLSFEKYGIGSYNGCDTIHKIFLYDLDSKLKYNSGCDLAAVQEKKKATELKRIYFGESSEVYLQSLLDVSQLFSERLKYKKSFAFHKKAQKPYVAKIKHEFCNLSESGRAMYWNKASRYIDRTVTLGYNNSKKHVTDNGDISEAVYDALLLRKGLLLNTSRAFEEFVDSSHNEKAIQHLHEKKLLISHNAPQNSIDSMDYVILADLKSKVQEYKIKQLDITWKDVQNNLNDDDLAIEFFRTDNGEYGAVMLKKSWKHPKTVRLSDFVADGKSQEPIDRLLNNDLLELDNISVEYADLLWNVSRAIWTDEIVKNFPVTSKGRIYFSPDGKQQIVGIESLPFIKPKNDGKKVTEYKTIAEMYPTYRLSSTRELALHAHGTGRDAIIYGGLDYGMSSSKMEADTKKYGGRRGMNKIKRDNEGVTWESLAGTKTEAINITDTINQSHNDSMTAESYMDQDGTESSFKNLSEKNKKLIHIATHGYYNNTREDTEDPLNASGLCFAGANNRLKVGANSEDGILTAKEASTMNLDGLSMLTLSACETGLGSISKDGVFGLQRGFKMAGAQSILMSLWKVNDDATRMLMTEFYTNWIKHNMSKHQALEKAKEKVRATKEWKAPMFWSAFILLDALD